METYLRSFDWAELYDIALEFGADVCYDDDKWDLIQAILALDITIRDIENYLDEEYIPY
jgi:hypothetical protein